MIELYVLISALQVHTDLGTEAIVGVVTLIDGVTAACIIPQHISIVTSAAETPLRVNALVLTAAIADEALIVICGNLHILFTTL